ncbi:sulfite exporter TauE/SafE family protein [Sphingobium sp. H39-3-25]|uniref:sulfite exporter TauE/SafE family protein n=1 Tax=Sphingobium arseniciresistens TaxID=3030834 RepID=UPI0023B9590F|nr:sulfite exporter TauE/SafE family protein [Sphingobium arseniciresistens]
MIVQPLYAVAGLLVGTLVGLTGVGGGSLMTPLLVLMFGFHPSVAVGTDLLYASVTKSVGSLVHGMRGSVDWRIVGLLAAGSVPAAGLCLWGLSSLGHPAEAAESLIKTVLGVVLLLTAIVLIFRDRLANWSRSHVVERSEGKTALLTIILGVVIGAAVTLSSVGAGAIGATALIFLYPRLPLGRIVGSDIAHAVPLTLIAGGGHWLMGSVDFTLLLSLLAGSIPGIIIGSMASSRVADHWLRPALAVTLALVGSLLLF